jgi:hypothetical protein
LLAVARKFGFTAVHGDDIGRIEAHVLTVEGAGEDRGRWAFVEGKLSDPFVERLVTREVHAALREGELGKDGSLLWRGKSWALEDGGVGGQPVPTLAPVEAAA